MRNKANKVLSIIILAIIVLLIAFYIWRYMAGMEMLKAMMNKKQPPSVVTTTVAKLTDWHDQITEVGSTRAIKGVTVSTKVNGIVDKIYFKSGQDVKAGQKLVQLDNHELQATLQSNLASLKLAEQDYQRSDNLYSKEFSSRSDLDEKLATLEEAKAQVALTKAQLDQKLIEAPFSGKVGIREIDLGQYIAPGDAIVDLQQEDPLYVDFDLPAKYIPKINKGETIKLTTPLYPNRKFTGRLVASGSAVDKDTRTIMVRGEVPNPKGHLLPGLAVNVNVILPANSKVITLPQTAIVYNPYGDAVYRVKGDKVELAYVKVSDERGNRVVISSGLKAGDVIVETGQIKLHAGSTITVQKKTK